MKLSVYLETSVISYLTGPLSRNIIVAANQHITREWWQIRRHEYHLFISPWVVGEVSQGRSSESEKRLAILNQIPVLHASGEVNELALVLLKDQIIPSKASDDAYHIAVATVHKVNYLLTWNCKHIANAKLQPRLHQIGHQRGYEIPVLCTPYELLQEN